MRCFVLLLSCEGRGFAIPNSPGRKLSNSTELSSFWKAAIRLATQEYLKMLWNPKFHYRLQKIFPMVLILRRMNHSIPPNPISPRKKLKKKLFSLYPQANYTDRATAA
jgi:hypothetical protein